MNGMSKKLRITMIVVQAIVHLSSAAENKFWYACLIAGIVIIYKLVQCWADTKPRKLDERN